MGLFRGYKKLQLLFLMALAFNVTALPSLEHVISGQAGFDRQGNRFNISQESQFLHVQYDSFDIAAHESVSFQQPNIHSVVVNQVLSSDPTQIAGQLSANGQLFVLAPGGLVIHDGATIEAASFFASTLGVDNVSINEIGLSAGGASQGLLNNGHIKIEGGGYLHLLAPRIVNDGIIENKAGDVALTVADSALVRFENDVFAIEVRQAALDGVIENTGLISSVSGDVRLNANVRNQVNELVIYNDGEIKSSSVWQEGGDIYIGSNEGDVENHGLIESVVGEDLLSGDSERLAHIQIDGHRIANFGIIKNNGLGNRDAGSIELNAQETVVLMPNSLIQANADKMGDGGNVKVFSPVNAIFRESARIEAEAGFMLGDGGFVDVSGWQYIEINGRVSTFAINGENGEFLIDPYDVIISTVAESNQGGGFGVATALTYTPSGTPSIIDVTDLVANLKLGNVTVVTTGVGGEDGDITVSNTIDLDGTAGNTLTLNADNDIFINADIKDSNGAGDSTNLVFTANGDVNIGVFDVMSGGGNIMVNANAGSVVMANGSKLLSGGGAINLLANGGSIALGKLESAGGNFSIIASFNVTDGNGAARNVDAGGGDVNFNVNGNIGGTGFGSAIEIIDSVVNITADSAGINVYLVNGHASESLWINDVDFNLGDGLNLNVRANNGGNIYLSGMINDSDTGLVDSATINIESADADSDIIIDSAALVRSYGGNITYNSQGDVGLANTISSGGGDGDINITAVNVYDNNAAATDLISASGLITFNISGDVGGTDFTTALEIENSAIDMNATGVNSNVYLINNAATNLIINDVDYNGTGTFGFNVRTTSTGDLLVSGDIADSNAAGDSATIMFETQNAASDIIIMNGATVQSHGGDIIYNSLGAVGIVGTKTNGGDLTITAVDVYDNGAGVDIDTQGGLVTFFVSGDIGVNGGNGQLEIQDSVLSGVVGAANATWDFKAVAASSFLTLSDIDFDGANGFTLSALAVGGDLNITGNIIDSNAAADSATISLQTQAGNITSTGNNQIHSYGGGITYDSAGTMALPQTFSFGGAINLTAVGNITDAYSGPGGYELSSGGGIITINAQGHVGGPNMGDALEISDSILDFNLSQNNQVVYLSVGSGSSYLNIRNVDFDGADGLSFNVRAASGADIIISGELNDSVIGTVDSASFGFISNSVTSDIIVNDGATIHSGPAGSVTLNSTNDIYLTGIYAGTGGAIITAANDVIDNGDSDPDIQAASAVFTVNGDIGVGGNGSLEMHNSIISGAVGATNATWNFNTYTGSSHITLDGIDYNGADGFILSVVASNGGDINITGNITDSNAAADSATITLQTTQAGSDIIITDGSLVRSYGGGISYISADEIGLAQTLSSGGAINITAAGNVYDNSNTGSELSSDGGVITLNVGGNVGGTSQGEAIEIFDSILDVNVSNTNQNIWLNVGVTDGYLNIRNVDYDGSSGLIFNVLAQNGSDIIVSGDLYDSVIGTVDSASFNLTSNSATGDITINDGATIRSGGAGTVTLNSANNIYLTGIFAGSADTFITAANDIFDSGDTTLDIQSTGSVTLTVGRHIAGGDLIQISATTLNLNLGTGNHNIVTIGDIALGNIEINGASGAQLSIVGTGDIDITGSITDAVGSDDNIDLTLGTSTPGFLIFPDAGYAIPGSLTFWAGTAGIKDSTDERISITANSIISSGSNFLLNTGPVIFDLTVDNLDFKDDSGSISFEINNSKDLNLVDINGDGETLSGFDNLNLTILGKLTLSDAGLSTAGDLTIAANEIVDSDNNIQISANRLMIHYTQPRAVEYGITGAISDFNASLLGGLSLNITGNIRLIDWNSEGGLLTNLNDFKLNASGDILLPSTGLSANSVLWLQGASISDGDFNLQNINTPELLISSAMSDKTLELSGNFSTLDLELSGNNASLFLQHGQALSIQDLNSDGSSLNIHDGYAWLEVAGNVSLTDSISVLDSNNNGNEHGWMYLAYEGSAQFGVGGSLQITVDGSLEAGTPSLLDVAGSQLLVRQTGPASDANGLQFNNTIIQVIGGDAVFDIANESSNPAAYGQITMAANSTITALNASGDSESEITYADLQLDGSLNVAQNRGVVFSGYTLNEAAVDVPDVTIPDAPDVAIEDQVEQVLADVINETVGDAAQSVASEIQEETVATVESSPNVNFALNEMFSGCKEANREDSRCKVKDEISRFLGRFLMGGSMPKTRK